MLGLTPFGAFHTAISLIAVAAGIVALFRYKEISPRTSSGKLYIGMTIASCVTGLFIFHHGGFGIPHVLAIVTLLVLGVAAIAGYSNLFGRASRYVEAVSYSATFFFHFIPGIAETTTRLPAGAPLFTSPDAPGVQAATGVVFVLFLIGAMLQVRRMRSLQRQASEYPTATPLSSGGSTTIRPSGAPLG
jgi:uncharacterized membrane protein